MPDSTIKADTVLRRSNIITMDPRLPRAQAVTVRDGKFLAVGDDADIDGLVGPDTKVLDLPGKTALPGFIDAHIHVLSGGIRHVVAADCDRRSVSGVQEALRERVGRAPAGEWVRGFKFDDTKISENRFLTLDDLDSVSTDHPIAVGHRAGHVQYLNSKALEIVGYNRDTADPPGGRPGRDQATGSLNGVVYEPQSKG